MSLHPQPVDEAVRELERERLRGMPRWQLEDLAGDRLIAEARAIDQWLARRAFGHTGAYAEQRQQ
jgi:hypothetical protein